MNIFFDLDGVLVDPYPKYYKIHLLLTRKYSLEPLSYKDYVKSKQNKLPELFYLKDLKKENYIQERLSLLEHPKFLSLDPLYFDTKTTLETLKKKNKFFLITVRKNRKELLKQLKNLDIFSYFEKIYSSKSNQLTKPPKKVKEELLLPALLKNKAGKSIIVGDTEADILAGKHYAMLTVAIVNRLRTKEFVFSLKPDFTINSIGELIPIIDSIGNP